MGCGAFPPQGVKTKAIELSSVWVRMQRERGGARGVSVALGDPSIRVVCGVGQGKEEERKGSGGEGACRWCAGVKGEKGGRGGSGDGSRGFEKRQVPLAV